MNDLLSRAEVRREGRRARKALVGDDRQIAERLLLAHLSSLQAIRSHCLGVFIAHDGEPDLSPLIRRLRASGTQIALPVLQDDPDDFSMTFVPWLEDDVLLAGRYGIPVPPRIEPVELDAVLVSFVGFDQRGHRMGRGAGFFDRYLAAVECDVIGVGFEVQRFDEVPVEPHDVALPVIVTDLGVRFIGRTQWQRA